MSYAHTKRRKLIATLKRKHPRNWLAKFHDASAAARRRIEGRLIGSLQDALDAGKEGTP